MMMRSRLRQLAVIAFVVLLVAACSGEGATTTTEVSSPETTEPETSSTTASGGPSSTTQAVEADFPDVIPVGVLESLTGPIAFCGTQELQGMEVAVAEAEDNGFFGDSTIELIVEDDASNPDRAVAGYQTLVNSDAVGILGTCSSAQSAGIVQRAAPDQIPLILTTSGSAPLTENEFVFRAGVLPNVYAPGMPPALASKGVESTVLIIGTDNPVHLVLADEIWAQGFEEEGIEILDRYEITPEVQDISAEIASIQQLNPDSIGILVTGGQNLTVLTQLREAGLEQIAYGQIGMHNADFVGAGPVTNGTLFTTSFAPCFTDNSAQFAEAFEAATGIVPGFAAAHGYDAAWRLFLGIQAAGSVDRVAINDALVNDVTSQDAAQGPLTFDENGNSIGPGGVVEIVDGSLACVES